MAFSLDSKEYKVDEKIYTHYIVKPEFLSDEEWKQRGNKEYYYYDVKLKKKPAC